MNMTKNRWLAGLLLAVSFLAMTGAAEAQFRRGVKVRKPVRRGVQKRDQSGPKVAKPGKNVFGKISPCTLEVQQLSKDFETWGKTKTITQPLMQPFRWKVIGKSVKSGRWQLSKQPFKLTDPVLNPSGLLAQGYAGEAPKQGHVRWFKIDLSKYLPSQPQSDQKYYVRMVGLDQSKQPVGIGSLPVTITHTQPNEPTKFYTKGLHPELWKPLPIVVNMHHLKIVKASEEDDEEPYLLAAVVYADGTTIDPLNFPGSSVRIDSPTKTHENLPQYNGDLGTGDTVFIPKNIGRFEKSILPIGLDALDLLEHVNWKEAFDYKLLTKNTPVAVLVIALEEDATSTSAANAARNALIKGMRQELNKIVRNLKISDLKKKGAAKKLVNSVWSVKDKIQDKALDAAKKKTMEDLWVLFTPAFPLKLAEIADPDDLVGVGVAMFNYEDIKNAGKAGMSFKMDFNNGDAHYELRGRVHTKH